MGLSWVLAILWLKIFTGTPKLAFSFPIGPYSQLFETRDIPIGQQTKPSAQV